MSRFPIFPHRLSISTHSTYDKEKRGLTVGLDQVLELGEVSQLVITSANHFESSRKGVCRVEEVECKSALESGRRSKNLKTCYCSIHPVHTGERVV